eukprot:5925244-Pleurochrysis_carterae.AAC.1
MADPTDLRRPSSNTPQSYPEGTTQTLAIDKELRTCPKCGADSFANTRALNCHVRFHCHFGT